MNMHSNLTGSKRGLPFAMFFALALSATIGRTDESAASKEVLKLGTRNQGVDWPQFLGPTRDSKSPETGIISDWTQGLRIVWQVAVGESYGICSVSQGRVLQFDRIGDEARVRAFHAETGEPLWQFRYPTAYVDMYGYNGGPRCSPLVDEDRVYIFGAEGQLYCLSVLDGTEIWHVDTEKQFGVVQNFFGVGSNPVVEGDLLIVMVGGSPPDNQQIPPGQLDEVQPNNCCVVAFDKRSGEVRYSTGNDLASYASLQSATINGRRWCFAFARGGLLGFEPATGQIDFHYPWRARMLESVNASMPVVVGDQVLISETYGPGASLVRVKPGASEVVWRDDANRRERSLATHWNTPVHHDGFVYGSSGRHTYEAELRCVQWQSGKVMWSQPGLTRSSLLYVDGHFIVQSEDGVLRLIKVNPERYEEVGQLVLRAPDLPAQPNLRARPLLRPPCWAAPVLSHGLLYVRGDDRLVCLELIPQQP